MRRATFLLALLLGGCAVGPNYRRPPASAAATGRFVDPAAQVPALVSDTPINVTWWRLFNDPVLDRLIADALAHNTDVRVAVANVALARGQLSEARSGLLPTTTVSAGVQRYRYGAASAGIGTTTVGGTGTTTGSGGTGTGTGGTGTTTGTLPGTATDANTPSHYDFTLYNAAFNASYQIDLFGRVSRSIEASKADTAAAEADLDTARISVVAEVARTYAAACGYAQQEQVALETARLQDRTLDLTRRLFDAGRGTRRDVDQAAVLAENARAQAPGFGAEHRASLYALATLTGRPPAEVDAAAAQCTAPPGVTTPIPVGDGAALLARRPDVRAAERRLAGETARIGVATAALFPSVSIGGAASVASTRFRDLGKSSTFSFNAGPLLTWSFPNIAVARARIRQARASTQSALATFDGAILTALRDTEQALARYQGSVDTAAARARAAEAAEDAARLSRTRFDAGRDSFLQLLDSERDRASARAALAQARVDVANAQVALFNALGGGWEEARTSVAANDRRP